MVQSSAATNTSSDSAKGKSLDQTPESSRRSRSLSTKYVPKKDTGTQGYIQLKK